ncbi:MAG: PqqD family protein [Thermoleophilia bacterium]|nr:PqqD family protein [Thermoleophilia bacterium]
MDPLVGLNTVCLPSQDVVSRKIDDTIVIVPLTAGIGDADDELYTLNDTAQAIWEKLDGVRTLGDLVDDLALEFDAGREELEAHVIGFAAAMIDKGILAVKV